MEINVAKELATLQRMGVSQLRERYAEVFGEATTTGNRTWLVRRIAWRIQANAEGDLSERARQRAAELARDADLRITAPREKPAVLPMTRGGTRTGMLPQAKADDRLPPPGTVLTFFDVAFFVGFFALLVFFAVMVGLRCGFWLPSSGGGGHPPRRPPYEWAFRLHPKTCSANPMARKSTTARAAAS